MLYLVGLFTEGEVGDELLRRVLGVGAQLGVALPFSRAHEREADRMGQLIMAEAGFDPGESVGLWRRVAQRSQGQPMAFLSTHLSHDSRIDELRDGMEPALERYLAAIPASCGQPPEGTRQAPGRLGGRALGRRQPVRSPVESLDSPLLPTGT